MPAVRLEANADIVAFASNKGDRFAINPMLLYQLENRVK
jgi:hypothetical protein